MKLVAHSHAVIGISNSRISLAPVYLYSLQGGARELLFGSMVKYRLQ